MAEKFSILICSCDAYSDAWPMFFHLLKANWKGEFPKIYLNTETKQYEDADVDITVLNCPKGKEKTPWGERLLSCLERIDSEYVLFLLEDYYFESEIDTELVKNTVYSLEKHKEIAAFQFVQASDILKRKTNEPFEELPEFVKRPILGKFKVKAGPSMWRKHDLATLTRKNDSPWEWEYFGSRRTYFYGQRFYCLLNEDRKVFNYDVEHGGAIHRGKWVGYKMEELEKKFDFKLDYGDREVVYDWMKEPSYIQAPPPFYKRLRSVISNRTKLVANVFYGMALRGKRRRK